MKEGDHHCQGKARGGSLSRCGVVGGKQWGLIHVLRPVTEKGREER